MPEVDDLEERIRSLESWKSKLIGGAIVGAVAILGFMGITKYHEVPKAARDAATNWINEERPNLLGKIDQETEELRRLRAEAKELKLNLDRLDTQDGLLARITWTSIHSSAAAACVAKGPANVSSSIHRVLPFQGGQTCNTTCSAASFRGCLGTVRVAPNESDRAPSYSTVVATYYHYSCTMKQDGYDAVRGDVGDLSERGAPAFCCCYTPRDN